MKRKTYVYTYRYAKAHLFAKLNNRNGMYHNWNDGDYLIDIKNDNRFFLGVQRGGHSGGYWYVANIHEDPEGSLTICGHLVYNPDPEGNEQKKERWTFVLLCILLLPIVIVALLIKGIRKLVARISGKPLTEPEEARLDRFMLDYLCCKKQ